MAHFAKLNDNNIVEEVIVVADSDCNGGNFPESEPAGNAFLNSIGLIGNWKQTSYNGSFRKHFAGKGYSYSSEHNAFIPAKPYDSWTFNSTTLTWDPPTPRPEDDLYLWNEEELCWKKSESIDS